MALCERTKMGIYLAHDLAGYILDGVRFLDDWRRGWAGWAG